MYDALLGRGAQPITTPQQYRACHHLPEWYPLCADATPETVIVPHGADLDAALVNLDWPGYVVKDFVKSLTTQRGLFARNMQEIKELVAEIEHYRGMLEGGICIRKFEDLHPDSEERYFVFQGHAFACDGRVPALVEEIAQRIHSPFFSVDLARDAHGADRLIELGDGQVSDRKRWPVERFIALFTV